MKTHASDLLATVRRQGVVIEAGGDRLHIDAPAGVITEEVRRALAERKPELIATLREEQRLLSSSLSEFAKGDRAIEVRVPWLEDTLWFVPRDDHVVLLGKRGIRRGRIWTAHELADLLSIDGLRREDIAGFARLKVAFGAEIIEVKAGTDRPAGDHDASA